jgi:hypothetical protein
MTAATKVDYQIRNEGTLVLLWPISDMAVAWCEENFADDSIRWSSAYVIEHRYAGDIVEGLAADGLVGRAR